MTIPILPGPWNFLAGAGGALGAYGQGMSQRHIYEQQQAQQNAQMLASLVARGLVSPDALASPANQQMFAAGGMPGIQAGQTRTPLAMQQAEGFGREAGALQPGTPQAQMTFGVTTPAAAQVEQAKGAEAGTTILANEGVTKEQARLKGGIAAPGAAPLIESAQGKAAKAAGAESDANKDLWDSVRARLPQDPQFQKVAQYAAVHGLGFLTSLNEMYARLGAERTSEHTAQVRLITAVHNAAVREHQQAKAIWAKSMQDEIDRQLNPLGPAGRMTPDEQNAIRNQVVKDYAPKEPKMEDALNNAIAAYQADQGDYDTAVRDVAGGIAKAEAKGNPYETMKSERQKGNKELSDEKIDAATSLTPEQKNELKKIPFPTAKVPAKATPKGGKP